ncbi:MAG TPA: anthranilate synthase component I [Solirubrobacteraceae bacterium]
MRAVAEGAPDAGATATALTGARGGSAAPAGGGSAAPTGAGGGSTALAGAGGGSTALAGADVGVALAPSLADARGLAEEYNLIPLRHSFIDDCETPVSAFLKLRALAPSEPAFLLESAEQGQRFGRFSFIGFRPRDVLRWSLAEGGDPYALAADHVAGFRQAPLDDAAGETPFTGGAVGFFGYDLVRTVEPLAEPGPDPLGLPDMALMISDTLVVFDHLKHTVTILANADLRRAEGDVEQAYAAAAQTIGEVRVALAGPVPLGKSPAQPREMPEFQSNMEREQFEAMVARIIEYIYAGDAFQVVPSQRFSAAVPVESFSIYRGLRTVNPSPYMYFLDFGDFQVAGASPEPLLTVSGRRVSTRPIAGTRSRGADAEQDRRIAQELLEDPKERAEHVMLVDLGRNDLGRVCEAGSVEVETFMAVETYSHVMHIVSSVAGELRADVSAMDALRSVLPAGTLSGAPKVRAMQIIDELEPVKRGGYGGAIGYLSYGGDLDTCIHIRTVVVKDGVAHIQAGGGTVADAKPAYEYEESRAKARAVLQAVELAIAQPEWP